MGIPDVRAIERRGPPCPHSLMSGPPRRLAEPRLRFGRRGRSVAVVAAILLAVIVAGCGPSNSPASASPSTGSTGTTRPGSAAPSPVAPSPLSSQELASLYQTIEDEVVQIRQHQPRTAAHPTILDDPGIRKLTS